MSGCSTIETLSVCICGLVSDSDEKTIKYKIQVAHPHAHDGEEDEHRWLLIRRYSDFDALHRKLVDTNGIPRGNISLPPKRVLGNKDPDFIEKRRQQLDKYLCSIVTFFKLNPPEELAKFLELFDYEIMFMLRKMAIDIFERGDSLLQSSSPMTFSPFQIYAINERMKMALPSLANSTDKRQDFSHVIDFCTSVHCLDIVGSNIPLGSSSIIPNQYSFSLQPFKSVRQLKLKLVHCPRIKEVGSVRTTVESLLVQNCNLVHTNDLLLADTIYKSSAEAGPSYIWPHLIFLSLSNNNLKCVDDIGSLLPALRRLDLSFNRLTTVFNLTSLPYLDSVSYAGNIISSLAASPLHLLFGQILKLDLSSNQLSELAAFSCLYSLVELNLSCNRVADVEQVSFLGSLPCLDILVLTGNPVASSIDYRVRSLTYFAKRAADITLDNERAASAELDQISILQAIQMARNTSIR